MNFREKNFCNGEKKMPNLWAIYTKLNIIKIEYMMPFVLKVLKLKKKKIILIHDVLLNIPNKMY